MQELSYEYFDEDIIDEEEGLEEILVRQQLIDLLPPEEKEEIPVSELSCFYPGTLECYEEIPF